jgi:hypothetical protein
MNASPQEKKDDPVQLALENVLQGWITTGDAGEVRRRLLAILQVLG